MIPPFAYTAVENALEREAAVALLGPRQVGKTTLALEIGAKRPSFYLGLEAAEDRTFIVYGGEERYPKAQGIDVISLYELLTELKGLSPY